MHMGAISSPFKPGDPLFNRSPGHREVIGASPFWRRVAGMGDAIDHGRDLHARGGESARASGCPIALSGPVWGGDWGERARVPFNASENLFYSRREAPEISNPFSAQSTARRTATLLVILPRRCSTRARGGVRIDRRSFLTFSPDPMLNTAESAADRARTELALRSMMIGAGATFVMDLWAAVLRRFGIPSLSFALLGRWLGIVRVVAPLFILQPALGARVLSTNTPAPVFNSFKSLLTHRLWGSGSFSPRGRPLR